MLAKSPAGVLDGCFKRIKVFEAEAAFGSSKADSLVGVKVGCDVVAVHLDALRGILFARSPSGAQRSGANGGQTNHAGELG